MRQRVSAVDSISLGLLNSDHLFLLLVVLMNESPIGGRKERVSIGSLPVPHTHPPPYC